MTPLRAYILAGGRSTRFGSDKARAVVDGRPLLKHVAETLASVASDVTVVADIADKYLDMELSTIADRRPNAGPLAGLETALEHASEHGGSWIFLTSCDVVGLKPEWIRSLRGHCSSTAEYVAFRGHYWEPLIACYHVALKPRVSEHLHSGELALWKLLDASHGIALPLPADWPAQVQANTPGELASAVKQLKDP